MHLQKSRRKPYTTSLLILFTVVKNGKKSGGTEDYNLSLKFLYELFFEKQQSIS